MYGVEPQTGHTRRRGSLERASAWFPELHVTILDWEARKAGVSYLRKNWVVNVDIASGRGMNRAFVLMYGQLLGEWVGAW